ncbi:MAG: SDR family NAD(P)-dependent oxidoreductase [Anaerolineales bacterium]|nr:MAG: SDR family NAD(P)-dependent oxidoreductase [Anaerolineales bacterium]
METNWTTNDIPDQTGKVIIITGANSGIGYEAAKELARKGARIILACRNIPSAETAQMHIQSEITNARVEVMHLDLANLTSVRKFAEEYRRNYDRLDVLVNNAGIMMVPYGTTVDGFERQFGTNHLGHFALTGLLLDLLLGTPRSRVVNVSSVGHRFGTMDFDNLMYAEGKGYMPARAYGRSKLANLLFTYELQHRYEVTGADALAVAAHPGTSHTNLTSHMAGQWFIKLTQPLQALIVQSAAMGALPTLRAAVDTGVVSGQYYGPDGRMEQRGFPVVVQSNAASHNMADARKLWEISEELTGVSYGVLDEAA